MRYVIALILGGLVYSCGSEESNQEVKDELIVDTLENGIVEYELNESKLSAVDFNNKLTLIQQSIYDQINILFLSEPLSVEQNLDNAIFELELKSNDLQNTEEPDGGGDFKGVLMDLIKFYRNELTGEFQAMIPILETEFDQRTREEDYHLIDYDEQFAIKEAAHFELIKIEQEKFASANNFKITDL